MTTHPPPEPPVHRERAARTWVGTIEEIATSPTRASSSAARPSAL